MSDGQPIDAAPATGQDRQGPAPKRRNSRSQSPFRHKASDTDTLSLKAVLDSAVDPHSIHTYTIEDKTTCRKVTPTLSLQLVADNTRGSSSSMPRYCLNHPSVLSVFMQRFNNGSVSLCFSGEESMLRLEKPCSAPSPPIDPDITTPRDNEEFMGLGIDKKPAFEEYCIELQI